MTDLSETFGEQFAEQYENERRQRMQERESIDDETKRMIAAKAVESDEFSGEEPHFQFKSETGITHDVLLMTLPDLDDGTVFSRFMNQLDSGAVTCPLDYMGDWMSCLFNNEEDLTGMEPGASYLVIGNLDQWENDKGEMNDQVSPVRGVISMDQVKSWASDSVSEEVNEEPDMSGINEPEPEKEADEPEPEPEPEPEEEKDDAPELNFGGGGDGEEEEDEDGSILTPQDEDNIQSELDTLVEHKEEIVEFDEDDDRWNDVGQYVMQQLDLAEEEEVFEAVKDESVDYVLENEEEEEEDDEDDTEGNLFG